MLILWTVLSASAADPVAAMVTLARGPVTVTSGGKSGPAPAAPFLVPAGQSLELGAGAHVVFLRQGGAFTIDGPKVVDPSWFRAPAAGEDPVGALLGKATSLAMAGAARGAGIALTRPVPRAPVLELREVRWRCEACGAQDVALVDLRAKTSVWTGRGEGAVRIDGPALPPGTYAVRVGATELAVRVNARAEADAALAGAHLDTIADPRDRAATLAGALLLAGYPTDALTTLEAAGLPELVAETERLVGVGP